MLETSTVYKTESPDESTSRFTQKTQKTYVHEKCAESAKVVTQSTSQQYVKIAMKSS